VFIRRPTTGHEKKRGEGNCPPFSPKSEGGREGKKPTGKLSLFRTPDLSEKGRGGKGRYFFFKEEGKESHSPFYSHRKEGKRVSLVIATNRSLRKAPLKRGEGHPPRGSAQQERTFFCTSQPNIGSPTFLRGKKKKKGKKGGRTSFIITLTGKISRDDSGETLNLLMAYRKKKGRRNCLYLSNSRKKEGGGERRRASCRVHDQQRKKKKAAQEIQGRAGERKQ